VRWTKRHWVQAWPCGLSGNVRGKIGEVNWWVPLALINHSRVGLRKGRGRHYGFWSLSLSQTLKEVSVLDLQQGLQDDNKNKGAGRRSGVPGQPELHSETQSHAMCGCARL
jgi:hypothetical protein